MPLITGPHALVDTMSSRTIGFTTNPKTMGVGINGYVNMSYDNLA
jgi:hypothetical protein